MQKTSEQPCECAFLRRRITELQQANTAEVERRRGFEEEANQAFAEQKLLRTECMRLRELVVKLGGFIEASHANADEKIPEDVAEWLDAIYPPDAGVTDLVAIIGHQVQTIHRLNEQITGYRIVQESHGRVIAALRGEVAALKAGQ